MQIEIWQLICLTLIAFIVTPEVFSIAILKNQPVMYGLITGIIMGDIKTGLFVGGTLQLMILGISTFGGASIPDYSTGAIIGTVYAVLAGKGANFGISLAVPVGLLMVQLDVLARFLNVFLAERVEKNVEKDNRKGIERNVLTGILTFGLYRAIPVFLMLLFGNTLIQLILNVIPDWIISGLSVAGGLLPAVGLAILLRYLPCKEQYPYLFLGFVLSAYLKLPIMAISIIGLVAAVLTYKSMTQNTTTVAPAQSTGKDESYYDGEYEE